jgi:hypothetical protein
VLQVRSNLKEILKYPSALDANLFLIETANLDGTTYLWTHNTAITNNSYTTGRIMQTYNPARGVLARNRSSRVQVRYQTDRTYLNNLSHTL